MKVKYRVILKVGYYEVWFDYNDSDTACNFAANALAHMVSSEDTPRRTSINIQIIDVDAEEAEESED